MFGCVFDAREFLVIQGPTAPLPKEENHMAETKSSTLNTQGAGVVMPFDSISEPGAYICNWSGHLLRVPEDGVVRGRSPVLNIVGPDSIAVTKISNDPFIPRTKAKLLAANFDVEVDF